MIKVARIIICGLLGLFLFSCDPSQESIILEDLGTLSDADALEQKLRGVKLEGSNNGRLASSFFPGADKVTTQESVMYLRKGEEIPCRSKYYFEGDEIVAAVYEWNQVIPGMSRDSILLLTENDQINQPMYGKLFGDLAKQLADRLGNPVSGDGKLHKENLEVLEIWRAWYVWDRGETRVELELKMIPKFSYRVFVKVYRP